MYQGLFKFSCTVRGVDIECYIEYEPGEPATFDDPGFDDCVYLHHAHIGDVDVINLLNDHVIAEIEEKALEALMDHSE